jgi:hypothetical protein
VLSRVAVGLLPSTIAFGASEEQLSESLLAESTGMGMMRLDKGSKGPFRELAKKFPGREWYVLATADTYLVPENLAALLKAWGGGGEGGKTGGLLLAKPDDVAGTVIANAALLRDTGALEKDMSVAGELVIIGSEDGVRAVCLILRYRIHADLKSAAGKAAKYRPELLSGPFVGEGEEEASQGLCAASVRFSRDWYLVTDLQKNREEKSQFYLIDYAVRFRRAQRRLEVHHEMPPLWYPTEQVPIHCRRRR